MAKPTPHHEAAPRQGSEVARDSAREKADSPASTSDTSAPATPASTDDPPPEVDLTGFSDIGPVPGPELGTVDDNQLWGADFGVLE